MRKEVVRKSLIVFGIFIFFAVAIVLFGDGVNLTGNVVFSSTDSDALGDVYVAGDSANTNFNYRDYLMVKWGTPKRNSYLNFNISAVPDDQIIDNASLCLYMYNDQASQTIGAYRVYDFVNESEVTWNTQPCGTVFDNASACNLTAESNLSNDGSQDDTWQCFNVTNMVREEYGSSSDIVSVVFHTEDEGNADSFYSKEYSDALLRPYLNVSYHIANIAPVISIVSPQDSASYGYNESLALNFSVIDNDGNLDSCWYNIDDVSNISLTGCSNVTFNVVGYGNYDLNLFANDSLGLLSTISVNFDVLVGAPTIIMGNPNNAYLNDSSVVFEYTPTDVDLEACELWGNFSGFFEKNQTNVTPDNGIVNNFNLGLNDGGYIWNVRCNDTLDNSAFNGNRSFFVDTVLPVVEIVEPLGAKTSRDISLSFNIVEDNVDSCWYNVYRGASLELDNTSVDCGGGIFSVTVDADFVVNLYVNDSAGHVVVQNSSFSVDTSIVVVTPPSGGSGGGGGGGSGGYVGINLEIDGLKGVLIPGEEKSLVLSVKNNGFRAVNKCKLKGSDESVSSDDIKNIASGEIVDFVFILKVVDDVPDFWVECLEGRENVSVDFVLYTANMSAEISNIDLEVGRIIINYVIGSENGFNACGDPPQL